MHSTLIPTTRFLEPRANEMGWANFSLPLLATQTVCTTFLHLPLLVFLSHLNSLDSVFTSPSSLEMVGCTRINLAAFLLLENCLSCAQETWFFP